ncbi:metallophosphoesterase [Cellulomonas sp. ATA003]|uniref:metallophosphoesterase n=1 Tax=Cellulomonas sp. ATA003 TaxID=3073064 RepID=UPI002873094C|nr:metallophosphoesterase [Cellulomonas sp. ATA003]WNB85881.1 metallophosphoesterase [Cellulomonas sp. ATA003]
MTSPVVRAAGALTVAGAAALAWASLVEVRWYALREVTVAVLPPGQSPLRVLHLSDLHLVPRQQRKIDWVRDLATLRPDLVVDTGDNMADTEALPSLLHALEPLLGTPGAFVLGSNDYFAPRPKNPARYLLPDARLPLPGDPTQLPADELAARLREAGWKDLTNRRDVVHTDGRTLSLVGVDDPHMDSDRFPDPAPTPAADLHLGVTHAPYTRVLDAMHADGADLVLAGHTHGGQLAVPGFGALVTNCDLDRGRVKGLHGWPGPRPDAAGGDESSWLHVSAGLGTSPYAPVRFACRPEATLLTLVAR